MIVHSDAGCSGNCASCAGCSGVRPRYVEKRTFSGITALNEENFERETLEDPALIAVLFRDGSDDSRETEEAFRAVRAEQPKVKFCAVDTTREPRLAALFGIDDAPAVALMQDRHILAGLIGPQRKQTLSEMIEKTKG